MINCRFRLFVPTYEGISVSINIGFIGISRLCADRDVDTNLIDADSRQRCERQCKLGYRVSHRKSFRLCIGKRSKRERNHVGFLFPVRVGYHLNLRYSSFTVETRDINPDFRETQFGSEIQNPPCVVEWINGSCKYGLNCVPPSGGDNCKSTLLRIRSHGKSAKFHYRRSQCFSSH